MSLGDKLAKDKTLREELAGLTMQGLLSGKMGDSSLHKSSKDWLKDIAESSVEFTDELIKQLDKK